MFRDARHAALAAARKGRRKPFTPRGSFLSGGAEGDAMTMRPRSRPDLVGQVPQPMYTFTIPVVPGHCRWCGCTENRPCLPACSWTDATQTLCSACQAFDEDLHSPRPARRARAVAFYLAGVAAAIKARAESFGHR
jgi:hypothetical protein